MTSSIQFGNACLVKSLLVQNGSYAHDTHTRNRRQKKIDVKYFAGEWSQRQRCSKEYRVDDISISPIVWGHKYRVVQFTKISYQIWWKLKKSAVWQKTYVSDMIM